MQDEGAEDDGKGGNLKEEPVKGGQMKLSEDKENALNAKPSLPLTVRRNLKSEEAAELSKPEHGTIWWYCDSNLRLLDHC